MEQRARFYIHVFYNRTRKKTRDTSLCQLRQRIRATSLAFKSHIESGVCLIKPRQIRKCCQVQSPREGAHLLFVLCVWLGAGCLHLGEGCWVAEMSSTCSDSLVVAVKPQLWATCAGMMDLIHRGLLLQMPLWFTFICSGIYCNLTWQLSSAQ